MTRENRKDDRERSDRMLYDLTDLMSQEQDEEFSDVVWDGLVLNPGQSYPPAGHGYPAR